MNTSKEYKVGYYISVLKKIISIDEKQMQVQIKNLYDIQNMKHQSEVQDYLNS